jgi:hypothetical protein
VHVLHASRLVLICRLFVAGAINVRPGVPQPEGRNKNSRAISVGYNGRLVSTFRERTGRFDDQRTQTYSQRGPHAIALNPVEIGT